MKRSTASTCCNLPDPGEKSTDRKGWLAIAKLTPLSLFISLLLMPNEAFDNVKIEKLKVKVVSALQ